MMKIRLSTSGQQSADGSFDWKDAVLDSSIVAGLTFFTTLGAASLADSSNAAKLIMTAGISAAAQFFLFLAVKRGIRKDN